MKIQKYFDSLEWSAWTQQVEKNLPSFNSRITYVEFKKKKSALAAVLFISGGGV